MGEVRSFTPGWSISRLAEEFGMDRKTVSRKLREAGVAPSGERDGYPVYSMRTAAPVLLGYIAGTSTGDPSTLPPMERRAYYQSENERLKVAVATGALIPAPEVEDQFAGLVKTVSQFFDTLPDVLERDIGLSAEQVVRVQDSCDRVRQALYEAVIADGGEADTDLTNNNSTRGDDR